MKTSIHANADAASQAAADLLWSWLTAGETKNVMVAAGNTPLELYRIVGKGLKDTGPPKGGTTNLSRLNIFMLDEYVGVPLEEPRNCANLLRRSVVEAWGIPSSQYYTVSSLEHEALGS